MISIKRKFLIQYLGIIGLIIIAFAFLAFALDTKDHHPDGITLANYACLQQEPFVGNGGFLEIYYPLIDCSAPEVPTLGVIIINFIVLIGGLLIFRRIDLNWQHLSLIGISLSFYIYSLFFPSKEIIISIALLGAIASKSPFIRLLFMIPIIIIRPVYFPILFASAMVSRTTRFLLIFGMVIFIWALSSGVVGESSMILYSDKAGEYEGMAKDLFETAGVFAPFLRIFWNFLGLPGSLINLHGEYSWHILCHLGTQIALIFILPKFTTALIRKRVTVEESILIIYVVLTATFPLPHTRYLYPIILAYIYIDCRLSRRQRNTRGEHGKYSLGQRQQIFRKNSEYIAKEC